MTYAGNAAEEIRAGRPDIYFNYIERTYGADLRSGTDDAIETFWLLYREISALGNRHSTDLFSERFIPLLPQSARQKLLNEFLAKDRKTQRDSGNNG
jgi:hypothetical protein